LILERRPLLVMPGTHAIAIAIHGFTEAIDLQIKGIGVYT